MNLPIRVNVEMALRRLTKPHGIFNHRVEHRSKVAGRGVDDLQYLGGRGLLLQCLARLGQEPRVLHRDDRLRREILQQRDLLVGERPHFLAKGGNRSEYSPVLEQRHGDHRVRAPKFDQSAAHRTDARLRSGIIDLRVGSAAKEALVGAPGLRAIWRPRQNFCEAGRNTAQRNRVEALAVKGP